MPRICIAVGTLLALLPLSAGCGPDASTALGTAELCDNGLDDDGDGLIDCEDPSCALHLACAPKRVEMICDNALDDDGDGLIDCEDPDCARAQVCNPHREMSCNDGLDNDGDGLIDCQDPDCFEDPACLPENCTNGVDDNGNGLIDCQDPDCFEDPACRPEDCTNGVDDNGNGHIDCADPGCAQHPACQNGPSLEICNDGVDNSGNGKVDCNDPECATNPWCVELVCDDGWDNDGNDKVDCEDPACATDPACQQNPTCEGAQPLHCESGFLATTRGRPNTFTTYPPCHMSPMLQGGELSYRYTNTGDALEKLHLALTQLNATVSFALIALPGDLNGCFTSQGCHPVDETSYDEGVHHLLISVAPGQTVYLVVDSVQNLGGEFHLYVDCPMSSLEDCVNGIDDNQNGLTDCWDPDCLGHPACSGWVSGGIGCDPTNPICAPGERCEHLQIEQSVTDWGICTRSCAQPDVPGQDCVNAVYPNGWCVADSGATTMCIMRCGASYLPNVCPTGTQCTDPNTGSTGTVTSGICAPVAP